MKPNFLNTAVTLVNMSVEPDHEVGVFLVTSPCKNHGNRFSGVLIDACLLPLAYGTVPSPHTQRKVSYGKCVHVLVHTCVCDMQSCVHMCMFLGK